MPTLPTATPATLRVPQAAAILGIGTSTAYRLIANGQFPCKVIQAGSSYRVVSADLERLIAAA